MSVSPNVFPGVNDYILVSRPACMLTLNDSATYTAIFTDSDLSGTVAKSWNWRLELFHKKGEYIVSSLQNSAASKDTLMCNWSVKVGNLPENYNWKRDEDGMIMGQVVVECLDSDPPYYLHSATVDVAFNSVPETKNTGDKK